MALKYPKLPEYIKAMEAADTPDGQQRDTSKLMTYLEMFTVFNARLKGHILTRKTAVGSWDWEISAYDNGDDIRAEEATTRLKKVINRLIMARVQTPLFGCFLAQLDWVLEGNSSIPKIVKIFSPAEIERYEGDVIAFRNGDKKTLAPLNDPFYLSEHDGDPARGGVMRSVGISEIIRYDMLLEWANFNKKQKGIIQGVDRGGDDQERSAAETALQTAMKNNYLLTSDLIDFKFHQITNSAAGSSFKEMIEALNNSIAIAILGQANTTELPKGGGSRAALQVQQMISADIMYSDVIATQNLINEQLLRWDFIQNFDKTGTKPVPWEFKVKLAEAEDLEITATVLDIASRFLNLNPEEAYQKLNLTPPDSGPSLKTVGAI